MDFPQIKNPLSKIDFQNIRWGRALLAIALPIGFQIATTACTPQPKNGTTQFNTVQSIWKFDDSIRSNNLRYSNAYGAFLKSKLKLPEYTTFSTPENELLVDEFLKANTSDAKILANWKHQISEGNAIIITINLPVGETFDWNSVNDYLPELYPGTKVVKIDNGIAFCANYRAITKAINPQ